MISVLVVLAGGLGAGARFLVDRALLARVRSTVPVATLLINVTGSFLLGALTRWALAGGPDVVVTVLGVGLLGGFTTFSAASLELVVLTRSERPWAAALLAVSMLVLSLAAAVAGYALFGLLCG